MKDKTRAWATVLVFLIAAQACYAAGEESGKGGGNQQGGGGGAQGKPDWATTCASCTATPKKCKHLFGDSTTLCHGAGTCEDVNGKAQCKCNEVRMMK
jgi:hypothetical protein